MAEEILKVEHLNKFYGDWQALHDINFELKKGEVVTLLGPSGSGKSTLIRTLNGLEPFRDGSIYFKGNKVNPSPKEWQELRQKIGMVFQSYDLFPNLTVLEHWPYWNGLIWQTKQIHILVSCQVVKSNELQLSGH